MTVILVIIALSLLILIHELGHFLSARMFKVRVEEFGIGFPPKLFSRKKGETEYSVNALPFGGFVRIFGENAEEGDDSPRSFSIQPAWKRAIILSAGVIANVVLGWMIFVVVFSLGVPFHPVISGVSENSPADVQGIEAGDIILEASSASLAKEDMRVDDFIQFVGLNKGEEISLTVQRSGDVLSFDLVPRMNPPEGEGSLGIELTEIGAEAVPFPESLIVGAKETWRILDVVVGSFVFLLTNVFTNPEIVKGIAGPVGIVSVANQASQLNVMYFLQLMAIISLNLVILNLIPFPALDGGRLLMLLIEKIKGSPVSARVQMGINGVGFFILILLMVVVTIQDIGRFF